MDVTSPSPSTSTTTATTTPTTTHMLCGVCCKPDGRLCKGCGHAAYCSVKCQKIHWPIHKNICNPAVALNQGKVLQAMKAEAEYFQLYQHSPRPCPPPAKWIPRSAKVRATPMTSTTDADTESESTTTSTSATITEVVDRGKPHGLSNGKLHALRQIKKAELIVNFQPIMIASNDRGVMHPPDSVLCLTCSKWFQNSRGYRCSVCYWPVCSVECEKGNLHTQHECGIFAKSKLRPPRHINQFYDDAILALRCLMLKKLDPGRFQQLTELIEVSKLKPRHLPWVEYDRRISSFLLVECRLQDFVDVEADEIIDYLRVIDTCSLILRDRVAMYSTPDYGNAFFCAKYVFPVKLCVEEECAPNTKWSIKHSTELSECSLRFHATQDIDKGSFVTACFTNINKYGATFPYRYRYQMYRFHDPCFCRRCVDPTELGSYLSAVSCQLCEKGDGYLLPKDPQQLELGWMCINDKCRMEVPDKTIIKVIEGIYQEMHNAGNDFYALLSLVWKFEEALHPNHYLFLMGASVCVDLFWGSVRGLPFFSPRYDFFIATINLANQAIRTLDASCPGGTLQRARILFQLQVAYAYKHLREFRRYMEWGDQQEKRCSATLFWNLLAIQEEAFNILSTEPYGSVEHELSIVLMEVIEDQMDLLCHQPKDVPMDSIGVYNLHKIYTRFSNEYYYPAIPIYEDKDIYEFVVVKGSCARHIDKIKHTKNL